MDDSYPDWFYLKIYAEPPLQNRLLLDYIYPVLDHYSSSGSITRWFFIRYSDRNEAGELSTAEATSDEIAISKRADPGYHLRVRLQIAPTCLHMVREVFILKLKQACATNCCKRWDEAHYIPEIDRYGGAAGIDLAHEIFCLNSQNIMTLLCLYSGNVDTETFIWLGDKLLQNLGLDEKARTHLYRRRFQWFASVYQFDTTDYEQLEKLYMKMHSRLEETFAPRISAKLLPDQFQQSSIKLSEIGIKFSRLEKNGRLAFPKIDILAALHHMHCNRAGYNSFKELSTLYCMHRWLTDRESD